MRTLKRIGSIALLATALAAIAGTASAAASSSLFEAGEYPATITGTPGYAGGHLSIGGENMYCGPPEFTSKAAGPSSTVTTDGLDPTVCEAHFGQTELKMGGCKYVFEPGEANPAKVESGFLGTFRFGPEGSGPTSITLPLARRTFSISPTGFEAEARYHNLGGEYVRVDISAKGMDYSGGCGQSTATLSAEWDVKATNLLSESTGLQVLGRSGLYLAGTRRAEPAGV